MTSKYIRLNQITFNGPTKEQIVDFKSGVNVICGASDTGKSFLAESVDFMLGGSSLKEIPERAPYSSATLALSFDENEHCKIKRALSGGNFELLSVTPSGESKSTVLKQNHVQGRIDNISGFLLDKIGLLNKRILKSKAKATTMSLSFRNLARLIIIQEGEVQSPQSPFLTGQFTTPTSEMATVKLLITGIDDSEIVPTIDDSPDNARQLALIEEIISDLSSDISDKGHDKPELTQQAEKLQSTIDEQRNSMRLVQDELNGKIRDRKSLYDEYMSLDNRQIEIAELSSRFALLRKHYGVDKERLLAIQESGSLFANTALVPCPLCGATPDSQHITEDCGGDVDAIVAAAGAEIAKIDLLLIELRQTISDLEDEATSIADKLLEKNSAYNKLDEQIRESISPIFLEARSEFTELVEKRAEVQSAIDMFDRLEKLQERKQLLLDDGQEDTSTTQQVEAGIPDASAHALSMKIERILRAWNFPGECRVHFDKERKDFVIDGKPRGSRGKGLRAITHAAITLGLMEYCQEQSLPHPGFVVIDSPLLAYFEPEGEDDTALQGTDLKERFYEYLIQQHGRDSQVVVIENQHPPEKFENKLNLTVFTRNPTEGRFGLL